MRMFAPIAAAAALALAGTAVAQDRPLAHETEWLAHEGQPIDQVDVAAFIAAPSGKQAALTASKEVVGYYPYWITNPSWVPWETLTRLSWFAIGADANGNMVTSNGWGGSAAQNIVDTAHGYGIDVLLTVTIFDDNAICSVVSSASRRNTFINMATDQVNLGDADGISIDFETTPASCMDEFELFISELSDAFHRRGWLVDIATPAVDWSWGFDYAYLADTADSLFIMGYNYHYSGSNPGPVDPLYGGGAWGPYSLDWTVQDYLADASAQRDNIILGLPLYGFRWPSTSTSVPGTSAGSGTALFYADANAGAASHGARWDTTTHTPYYTYTSGGQPYQVWYQTPDSVEDRLTYADANALGGIGFWALGYDEGDLDLWSRVDAYAGTVVTGPVGDLVGYVRDSDIFEGAPIPGALVTLSNGTATTVDANGYYQFLGLPAGVTYTVRASADCYVTATDTRYIEAGITNWKSMALEPVVDCTGGPGCKAPPSPIAPSSTAPGGGGSPLFALFLTLAVVARRRGAKEK